MFLFAREAKYTAVYIHISPSIPEGTRAFIYISGTSGTGNTVFVADVIPQTQYIVALEEFGDFTFVEIDGIKVTFHHPVNSLLCKVIKSNRKSAPKSLVPLDQEGTSPANATRGRSWTTRDCPP